MLSEIYPGSSPKMGSTYWDQILEVGVISVSRRVLKRLLEFLEQVQYYACIYGFFFFWKLHFGPLNFYTI
jgi:hypothetical protein